MLHRLAELGDGASGFEPGREFRPTAAQTKAAGKAFRAMGHGTRMMRRLTYRRLMLTILVARLDQGPIAEFGVSIQGFRLSDFTKKDPR